MAQPLLDSTIARAAGKLVGYFERRLIQRMVSKDPAIPPGTSAAKLRWYDDYNATKHDRGGAYHGVIHRFRAHIFVDGSSTEGPGRLPDRSDAALTIMSMKKNRSETLANAGLLDSHPDAVAEAGIPLHQVGAGPL